MSSAPVSRPANSPALAQPRFVSLSSDVVPRATRHATEIFVSTFRARPGKEPLLRHELERLVTFTRRESNCLFCDLFRLSADGSVFVIHSVWNGRVNWLRTRGWLGHPAGTGLLDQCLLTPIEVVEMEEIS
jgi:hypothetical protein